MIDMRAAIEELFVEAQDLSSTAYRTEFGELTTILRRAPERWRQLKSAEEIRARKVAYAREWYRNNRQAELDKKRAYTSVHRGEKSKYDKERRLKLGDALRQKKRARAKENRPKETKRWLRWYAQNREHKAQYDHARRSVLASKMRAR